MVKNLPANAGDMGATHGQAPKIPHAAGAKMIKIWLLLTSWEDGNLRALLQDNEVKVAIIRQKRTR